MENLAFSDQASIESSNNYNENFDAQQRHARLSIMGYTYNNGYNSRSAETRSLILPIRIYIEPIVRIYRTKIINKVSQQQLSIEYTPMRR